MTFVDLRACGIRGRRFALYDHRADRWLSLGADAWESWAELLEDALRARVPASEIAAMRAVCPGWTLSPGAPEPVELDDTQPIDPEEIGRPWPG